MDSGFVGYMHSKAFWEEQFVFMCKKHEVIPISTISLLFTFSFRLWPLSASPKPNVILCWMCVCVVLQLVLGGHPSHLTRPEAWYHRILESPCSHSLCARAWKIKAIGHIHACYAGRCIRANLPSLVLKSSESSNPLVMHMHNQIIRRRFRTCQSLATQPNHISTRHQQENSPPPTPHDCHKASIAVTTYEQSMMIFLSVSHVLSVIFTPPCSHRCRPELGTAPQPISPGKVGSPSARPTTAR